MMGYNRLPYVFLFEQLLQESSFLNNLTDVWCEVYIYKVLHPDVWCSLHVFI